MSSTIEEITRDFGGIMCGCSPAVNGHASMPLAPAGLCMFCGTCGPFYQQALERAQLNGNGEKSKRMTEDIASRYSPVDWRSAFSTALDEVDWLFPPLIEAGTLNVLFGLPGVGKSLLTLEIALDVIRDGKVVMMIDEENRVSDLVERLKKFGCKPDDLDRLVVYNFAKLPPLDTADGGQHLMALAEANKPALVVLDTCTRMIEGDENTATTWLQTYRHTLAPLKGMGIAVLRLDHQGKDASRGQRGSSAKDGDVDAIWRLKFTDKDDGRLLALEREKTRSGHGEDWVLIRRLEDPLRHEFQELDHLPVTKTIRQWADNFDHWGIPRDAGRPTLREAVKEHNGSVDTTILAIVARYRKSLKGAGIPPAPF